MFIDDYSKGELETLSIGDYGKQHNIKAQFLGYNKDINGVPNMSTMPLSEKWVITLSTQYGCTQKCTFCLNPSTLISTPNGQREIHKIKEGDLVIGQDELGQNLIQTVTNTMKSRSKTSYLQIHLENGKVLKITKNHEVKTLTGWKQAGELTLLDEIIEF